MMKCTKYQLSRLAFPGGRRCIGRRFRMTWIAAIALSAAPPVAAQTQVQQDRLDRVSQFLVTAPMCRRLGMTVDPDLPVKAEKAVETETGSWSVDQATVRGLMTEALSRQGAILRTDLEAAAGAAKTDAQLRGVRTILLGYGRTCLAATADPIFSPLIKLPPGYNLETAVTAASDAMLEGGGLASWQTPRIQARGDLMMAAGTCRGKIGAARSDALVAEFGQSDDPRVRGYYRKAFDEGLADPSIIETLAGCHRALQKMIIKAR